MNATHEPGRLSIVRHGRGYLLTAEQTVARGRDDVFPFFADAANLQRITPPFLRFRILTPRPIEMRTGATIDYALRVHGLPMRWRSVITEWAPPFRFVDEQARGPYRRWRHEHAFHERDGATVVRDRVEYRTPGGALVHRLFVERDVRRIFAYRMAVLDRLFGGPAADAESSDRSTANSGTVVRLDSN
jgi:ligand-binding SRPBCC domain-containing protein